MYFKGDQPLDVMQEFEWRDKSHWKVSKRLDFLLLFLQNLYRGKQSIRFSKEFIGLNPVFQRLT